MSSQIAPIQCASENESRRARRVCCQRPHQEIQSQQIIATRDDKCPTTDKKHRKPTNISAGKTCCSFLCTVHGLLIVVMPDIDLLFVGKS